MVEDEAWVEVNRVKKERGQSRRVFFVCEGGGVAGSSPPNAMTLALTRTSKAAWCSAGSWSRRWDCHQHWLVQRDGGDALYTVPSRPFCVPRGLFVVWPDFERAFQLQETYSGGDSQLAAHSVTEQLKGVFYVFFFFHSWKGVGVGVCEKRLTHMNGRCQVR